MKIFFITLAVIFLAIFLWFTPNMYGYVRFKQFCSSEGGLKIYEPLEKNVGWLADDYNNAHVAATLKFVEYVRYKDKKDGITYDLRYLGGDPQYDKAYQKIPADESKTPMYKWSYQSADLPNEVRLGKTAFEIFLLKDNRLLVRFNMFGYSWFDRNRMPLGVTETETCFAEGGATIHDYPRSFKEIISTFKN